MPRPYDALFPVGAEVRIAQQAELERFGREWKHHTPLTAEQISYGGAVTVVKEVGYYHGGDPLYQLERVPGIWHEECLSPA